MRRNKPASDPVVYKVVFDAVLAFAPRAAPEVVTALAAEPETLDEWHTGVWRQWYAAYGPRPRCSTTISTRATGPAPRPSPNITAGNPIASGDRRPGRGSS